MNSFNDELKNRLSSILDYLGCGRNGAKLARKINVNAKTLQNAYHKQTMPTLKLIAKIAIVFPAINYNWLLTGQGQMLNKATAIDPEQNDQRKDFLIKELESKNKLLEHLQKENTLLKDKVTALLEDKINYLQK